MICLIVHYKFLNRSIQVEYNYTLWIRNCDAQIKKKEVIFISSLWLVTHQEKDDGTPGDLLIKQARNNKAIVQATDEYAQRVSIDEKYSLLITQASLKDQKTFTCMVVSGTNLMEYPVSVAVHSKLNIDTKHKTMLQLFGMVISNMQSTNQHQYIM